MDDDKKNLPSEESDIETDDESTDLEYNENEDLDENDENDENDLPQIDDTEDSDLIIGEEDNEKDLPIINLSSLENESISTKEKSLFEKGNSIFISIKSQLVAGKKITDLSPILQQKINQILKLWTESANLGYSEAYYNLGLLYQYGKGVEKNYKKAISYFENAIKLGNTASYYQIGLMYYDGDSNLEKNDIKALENFEKSNNSKALNIAGIMYSKGEGVERDLIKAKENWEKAADLDNEDARYNLKLLAENDSNTDLEFKSSISNIQKSLEKPISTTQITDITQSLNMEYDDDDDEEYTKIDEDILKAYKKNHHPEEEELTNEQIMSRCGIVRDNNNNIIDPLHKTLPVLTKYEYAKIIGLRSAQIESGASPLIPLESSIIDGYLIAEMEIRNKKLPYIIRRPLPGGGSEYWKLEDLEILI